MYRYFVLVWDGTDADSTADAQVLSRRLQDSSADWARVLDAPGLMAFHAGAGGVHATSRDQVTSCETRLLSGRRKGVVFGRMFRTGQELTPHGLSDPIDATESERICASGGSHLIENYWGRYVAVFREGAGSGVSVLRDPTGGLPCFITKYRGVHIVFSEMESCLVLRLLTFSINWKFIAGVVPYSALQIRETGLNEVSELQAGERAAFRVEGGDDAVSIELIWNPSHIAARARITDPGLAIAAVRETVKQCVHAWASLHDSIVHNLSGGLDSSIVLGCLRGAPNDPRITCLHYYAPSSGEDERQYANLVARHMGAELIECELDPTTARLERMGDIRPAPKPWFYVYDLIHSPVETALMAQKGATASVSGAGGDGLFVQARAELAVADFLQHRGFRPGALRVALDAARINHSSVWRTLQQGMQRYWKPPTCHVLAEFGDPRAIVPPDVMNRAQEDPAFVHPWIRSAEGLSHGLLWQILCLSIPSQFYESFGGATDFERTPVLMSQPLIELCLRIPAYVWISGGRDRAIARKAFADVLPRAVVQRTAKGLSDRYNRRMLDENAIFLREMLLDGHLVREGLLDRKALAAALEPDPSSTSFEYNDVLRQHLCTEIWLRRWTALTNASAK